MFYIRDKVFGRYVVSIVPTKSNKRVIYFGEKPTGARWVTRKGADGALDKIRNAAETNPPGAADALEVVEII